MGTVGLNFGSATSGTGFDVSSTVSTIVANLQKVETPWKTQLSTLESQDTVISNLGTLLSNISNDVSQLTDADGIMAQKTGSSSDTNVLELTAASSSATAGTHTVSVSNLATTSSGYLNVLSSGSVALSGSITVKVGSGTAQTVTLNSSDDTLSGLASAINSAGIGVTASVLTDSSGSRLSLVSGTSGAGGNLTVDTSQLTQVNNTALAYTAGASSSTGTLTGIASADLLSGTLTIQVGSNAAQTINVDSADSDNTLSTLEQAINGNSSLGVSASIVKNSDGTESLSLTSTSGDPLSVTSSVNDVGTPLNYTSAVTGSDAQLTVDGVELTSSSNTVTSLIPGLTFQLLGTSSKNSDGSLEQVQVVIGNDNTAVESTINSMVTDYNSLVSAINVQQGNDSSGNPEPLFGSPTLSLLQQQLFSAINGQSPNGYLDPVSAASGTVLSGSISIQVGSNQAQTIQVPSDNNTLAGLADAINSASMGVTASVITKNGESTLSLLSQTAGSAGALTVTSNIAATSDTALSFAGTSASSGQYASGSLTTLAGSTDALSGSISIQVGSGTAQTITLNSSTNTLQGLADAINGTSGIGVEASVSSDGKTLSLVSQTPGSGGDLTVSSNLLDTADTTATTLNYNASSDISTLASLGISLSSNYDGTLTFDASTLDSVLDSDYSGVLGFLQNANSWGQTFSTVLENAGTSSTTGILALAKSSNSNSESTLNADISKEETLISAQQTSLTAELNSANEILQELPEQLQGLNQLYSAITGYNEQSS